MIARASRLTALRVNTSKLSAMFSDTSFSAFSSVCFDAQFSYRMVGCFLLQERPNPSSKRQIFHSLYSSTDTTTPAACRPPSTTSRPPSSSQKSLSLTKSSSGPKRGGISLQQKASSSQLSQVNRWEVIHLVVVFDGWNKNRE